MAKWQGRPDLADKFIYNSKDEKGIHLLLSFPRVSLLYPSNELFLQEQLQYSSLAEDARGMSWLSFAMKTRNGYTWVMGGKVEQSIKKESWGKGREIREKSDRDDCEVFWQSGVLRFLVSRYFNFRSPSVFHNARRQLHINQW